MSFGTGMILTVLLLLGNGFFVAAEFALVAAKRPRLEQLAAGGSRAAAAAVSGIRELSLMLAGAQLGITMCSLGLGVVAEPAIASVLVPPFHAAGLSSASAHAVSFVIALAAVTFLHMVIGEMAPKSWAIARPERSALLLALPFRGFTKAFRLVLTGLNGITNALLRLVRVKPRDSFSVSRTPEQLKHLVEESRRLGLIEEADRNVLRRALEAPRASLTELVVAVADMAAVSSGARPQEIIDMSLATDHNRLLVREESGELIGLVHVRDAYLARIGGRTPAAAALAHPVPVLSCDTPLADAVSVLQDHRSQLGLVQDGHGTTVGMISLDDLLTVLLTPA